MVAVTNTRVIFKEIPSGYPEPGKTTVVDTSETIDLDTVQVNGGILVKTITLSIDPYQRGRMRDEKIESYVVRVVYEARYFTVSNTFLLACFQARPAVSSSRAIEIILH
jgi:NADPH-dependent curcumin reductase CurA